jgi:hypothetical protein
MRELPAWADDREELAGPLATCADVNFERGREEGKRLTLDEALDFALTGDG